MNNKGMTMVELLIVVVIIGILAAIAIPNYSKMQDRAREGSVKSNMHTVVLAVEDYSVLNNGNYAADAHTGYSDLDELFRTSRVTNPFSGQNGILVVNTPANPGEVGYDHDGYNSAPYTVQGFGRDDYLRNPDGSILIMSPR